MLCLVPSSLRKFRKAESMKCDPPSLYHPWCAKSWKDNLMEHLTGMLCISGSTWHGFDPFGDVVYGDQDILATLGLYERSHIVDAPHVEKFNLKVIR